MIVVTGTGSSGTSVLTDALRACGATISLDGKFNPATNRPYPVLECAAFNELVRRPKQALTLQAFQEYFDARREMEGVQVVKHPGAGRMTILDGWESLDVRYVVCLRDFEACVKSHEKYARPNRRRLARALVTIQRAHAMKILGKVPSRVLAVVWYESIIASPAREFRRVADACGLPWRREAASVFKDRP